VIVVLDLALEASANFRSLEAQRAPTATDWPYDVQQIADRDKE
jgi:hypothetical protein